MKRLTIEYVRKKFEERNYTLLSNNYINAHQKLKFQCNKGHMHAMTYANLKRGNGCELCANKNTGDRCRLNFNIIKESFEKEGYKLLTTKYIDSKQKLEYICPIGHKHSICWSNWRNGQRCAVCAGQAPKTIGEIKKSFESAGYALLDIKYEYGDKKLSYICPKNHEGMISWNSWNQGHRCTTCFRIRNKNNIENIKKAFESKGYVLLSTEYKNAYSYLDYICPEGHRHSMAWNNFQQGTGCPTCAIETTKKKLKKSIEDIREAFNEEGYALLTTKYENSAQKLEFRCPKGHLHEITWAHWSQGVRCIKCYWENNNGIGNANWRGGISGKPYCPIFKNKEWREMIYDRDKDKFCWNPLCGGRGTKETLHHIDYDKGNCVPANIIKVCNSCNSVANADREWWHAFYSEIMRRRSI
jgi:uncharacterized protein YkuJ